MLISFPRIARISGQESSSRFAALKQNRAVRDHSGRTGNQAKDAERGDALPRARFANQADDLARKNVEVHSVDGLGDARLGLEVGLQIPDLENGTWATRSPQPRIFLGIERFANRLADEHDQQQRDEHRRQREKDQPPFRQIIHALPDQFAPTGRGRGKSKAEKVQRNERA